MLRRLYEIIEKSEEEDRIGHFYDLFMIAVIFMSIIPLAMKNPGPVIQKLDDICLTIFIVDYLAHFITAPYKLPGEDKFMAYLKYPFMPMAIIDLVAILPSFTPIDSTFRVVRLIRVIRLSRVFRLFRLFKLFRYSSNVELLRSVWKKSRDSLIIVSSLAVMYIFASALIVFNAEPDTFKTFFEALYWAVISLATIGYGDVVPVTHIGRLITMFSAFFGIAIIALPSGIVTTAYMSAVKERDERNELNHMREQIEENMRKTMEETMRSELERIREDSKEESK